MLGSALGAWLRSFHDWGSASERAETRAELGRNAAMKDLKFYVNYSMLLDTVANFPSILNECEGVFGEVRDFAAAELGKLGDDGDGKVGIIHGDFWTGKYASPSLSIAPLPEGMVLTILLSSVLVPDSPLTDQSAITAFVVDWEMTQIGHRALDLGQMVAELYETKLFKKLDSGMWVLEGFLEGYGALSDAMAFRTAIHVGVHLVCWGSRVPGWGGQREIEHVVAVGRDLIVQGWRKNRAWFEDGCLRCLFA